MSGFFRSFSIFHCLWFVASFSAWTALILSSPFDPDYAAGEMLDNLLAWSETGVLYNSLDSMSGPFRVQNYPPLFFVIVRLLNIFGLDPLTSGRLINLVAMASSLYLTFRWLRSYGLNIMWSLFGISLSCGSVALLFFAGQFHIQWLAVGLSLTGLFFLDRFDDPKRTFISGILCGLACLTKQTQIVAALVGGVWLARFKRSQLSKFVAGFCLSTGFGALWLTEQFGTEVWKHIIIYTVGSYSIRNLVVNISENMLPWCCFFLLGVLQGITHKEGRNQLRWWYFVGTSLALLSVSRLGASYQYFIEWHLATILWVLPWLPRITSSGHSLFRPIFKHLMVLLSVWQVFGADVYTLVVLTRRAIQHMTDVEVFPNLCKDLLAVKDFYVVSDTAGIVRACGLIPALHPFIVSNLSNRGIWNEKPFGAKLARKEYPLIVLSFDPYTESDPGGRWTTGMLGAILKHYYIANQYGRFRVFRPKFSDTSAHRIRQLIDIPLDSQR